MICKDLDDLPDEVRNTMLFIPIETIKETIDVAFLSPDRNTAWQTRACISSCLGSIGI
jgi:hypothetical protein